MKLKLIASAIALGGCALLTNCDDNEPAQQPEIISVSPETGLEGTPVVITGMNFNTTPASNVVTFNGVAAEVISSTKTEITTKVPAGAASGKIELTVNGKTAISPNDFVVMHLPHIASFSPETGYAGEATVTINGHYFSSVASENVVKFNGVAANVTASTETSITTTLPVNATTGKIEVTVKGHTVTSANDFLVYHAPLINDFNPSSGLPATSTGYAGATVTISGNYFSDVGANNIVKFNTTTATVLTASATQLTVEVPNGATTGKISVVVNNKEALSSSDFTVAPTNTWTVVNNTNDALLRSGGIAFVIGTKIYFGLGQNASNTDLKDIWAYDTETNEFTKKADFAGDQRNGATAFTIGDKGYVCTGFHTGTPYKDLWEYDPDNDSWTKKADFPGAARSGAISFSMGEKGYVGTGYASLTHYADFWEYTPGDGVGGGSWTQKADVGTGVSGRTSAAHFVINSKGYIGGGINNGNRKDFWEYTANEWTSVPDATLSSGTSTGFSFSLGTKGFVKIGISLWMFDPANNQWTKKNDLPASFSGIGVNVGNVGYVITGSSTTRIFYKYVPN